MPSQAESLAQTTEGPALIGIFLNLILFGVMISQTAFYFASYPKDPLWMKIYVSILFLADSVNSAFDMAWIYSVLVVNFGNFDALSNGDWLFGSNFAMNGIIATQAQLFYAWRIYKLTASVWLTMAVAIPSTLGGLCAIGTAIGNGILQTYAGGDRLRLEIVVIIWLMGAILSDLIITFTLTLYLYKHRSEYKQTNGLIARIIQLIVANGVLTATTATADAIIFLSVNNSAHLAFNYPLCKLYGNAVMSTLNARVFLNPRPCNSHAEGDAPLNFRVGPYSESSPSTLAQSNAADKTHSTRIMVDVEAHELTDMQKQVKIRGERTSYNDDDALGAV